MNKRHEIGSGSLEHILKKEIKYNSKEKDEGEDERIFFMFSHEEQDSDDNGASQKDVATEKGDSFHKRRQSVTAE